MLCLGYRFHILIGTSTPKKRRLRSNLASKGQSPKEETTSIKLRPGKSSNSSKEASEKTSENTRKPSSMYIIFEGTLKV